MRKKVVGFKEIKEVKEAKDAKENYIREIEKKAIEQWDVVKFDKDTYLVPENFINSEHININFIECSFVNDKKLKDDICALKIEDKDYISVFRRRILGNNKQLLEVVVNGKDKNDKLLINGENKIGELRVDNELRVNDREALINMIGYLHKDKSFYITYYLNENFKFIERLISDPIME